MTQPNVITFRVYGTPKPGGSKRSFVPGIKPGMRWDPKRHRPVVVEDCKGNPAWRESVREAALAVAPKELLEGPLLLTVRFLMTRPKYHYRTTKKTGTQLRDDAPNYHTTKPDRTKLLRSTEDALTGVLWRDDTQVVDGPTSKVYTEGRPGAEITVQRISNQRPGKAAPITDPAQLSLVD